jgi:chromosome partitioning protein
MGQLSGNLPDFAEMFNDPSIERMLTDLSDHEFEHFVGYVFEQAGYRVEDWAGQYGHGLDLKLFTGPMAAKAPYAGVSVKHFSPGNLVNGQHMMNFRGAVGSHLQGYAVTTSRFNEQALKEAKKVPQIWPIDGEHLLRYIRYVRGTRTEHAHDTEGDTRLHTNALAPISPEVFLAADDVVHRPAQTTTVITVANHKGGVGKTTSALNLAFGLAAADRDQQVLLVDMDPQANLTRDLPSQAPDAAPAHIGDYFARKRQLADLVRQTQFKRVWLIPSDTALTRSDEGIAAGPGAELRFVRDLHASAVAPPKNLDARPFDWIIIDTGPSMGLFTRSALAASHGVLMPVAPGVFAEEGADLLLATVNTMQALVDRPIHMLGCLITQWQDNKLNNGLLATFENQLKPTGLTVLKTRIELDKSNIEKAHLEAGQGERKTLFTHHKKSKAAIGYAAALQEVLDVGQTWRSQ